MNDTPTTREDPAPGDAGPPGEEMVAADDSIIGVAFRWSLAVIVGIGLIVGVVLLLRGGEPEEPEIIDRDPVRPPDVLSTTRPERPAVTFTDVTADWGIDFVHTSGAVGDKLLPETMGSGVAVIDFDDDGDPDLLFANGAHWPTTDYDGPPPTPALYRNDGEGRFEDVTAGSGLDVSMHGLGIACGDYDGDGRTDVFLANLGPDRLLRNLGDGTFEDVTDAAGVAGADDGFSSSAGFFDADRDGDLDLFVCTYVVWSREIDITIGFSLNGTDRAYGPPTNFRGTFCTLFRNEGDGSFTDVSGPAGIQVVNAATGEPKGKALAVTFDDLDGDGVEEILVANDTVDNFVFRRTGSAGLVYEEVGLRTGIAVAADGQPTGAMGIDVAEYLEDGGRAVAIGNFSSEATSFFVQQPRDPWQFADMAGAEGIGSPSRLKLSFGLFFFDYDLDGRLDLLQANGHLEEEINQVQASQHYRQPAQLFWNGGPEARPCFAVVPEDEVGDLARPIVGRGAAYADLDGDGDLDAVLTQTNGPPLVLRNDQDLDRRWLRVRVVGAEGRREAIGARVELTAGGVTQRRTVMPTRSYLSQVERPVTFGLGDAAAVERLRVVWPDGVERVVAVEGVDRVVTVTRPE